MRAGESPGVKYLWQWAQNNDEKAQWRGLAAREGKQSDFSFGEVEIRKPGNREQTEEAAVPLVAVMKRINSGHMFPASVMVTWTGGVSEREGTVPGLSISPEFPAAGVLGSHGTMAGQLAQEHLPQLQQTAPLWGDWRGPSMRSPQKNTWL